MDRSGPSAEPGAGQLRRNALLARLPKAELEQVQRRAEVVEMELRQQVYQPGGPIEDVYFPIASVISMVAVAEDQTVVEVATIGWEGMVGLPLFLGAASSPQAAFCQIPGPAVRLAAHELREVLTRDGVLHRMLSRYVQAAMVQIAQNVVCNNTHSAEQRAARWLLTTQDRVDTTEIPLTQEYLGQMLGLRRPTVSETARRLQARGLIRYRRGHIAVTDSAGLRALACGCYSIVKAEFDNLSNGDRPDQ